MEKKNLYLKLTIFVISVIVGAATIMAVKADDFEYDNCNGAYIDFYIDADLDGFGDATGTSTAACSAPSNYVADNSDCDDTDANINPGELESCDGYDNDCDGQVDEGIATTTYYWDADGDTYGTDATTTIACSLPEGFAYNMEDCDDSKANTYPGADELCDGYDNDCDGQVDEGIATTTYYWDSDGDTYGTDATTTIACSLPEGFAYNMEDCDDSKANTYPGADELCDGYDNDCDGQVDEGVSTTTYYIDEDGDGYGTDATTTESCGLPVGYADNASDCNDFNASINPGADEICDNKDNDCDGSVDESCVNLYTYYRDADGDGYGNPNDSTTAQSQPSGYVSNNDDCNDTNANINPGKKEICDDDIDNDCDGSVDEGCAQEPTTCGEYKNHGQYVSAWAHWTNWLKKLGEITGREKGQIMSQKAESNGNTSCNELNNNFNFNYNNIESSANNNDDDSEGENENDDEIKKNNNSNKFKTKNNNGKKNK